MNRFHLFYLLLLLGVMPAHGEDMLTDDDLVARFGVCFDFGCKSKQRINLFESDWASVRALLADSRTAEQERERVGAAIALMESIVGMVSPTGTDRAGNTVPDTDASGQMDCIDESVNATTYLQLFADQGLLSWHRVRERVYRAPLLMDQHWAAQIEDLRSGSRYVVDSWPRAHAMPAVIQTIHEWSANVDPSMLKVRN